MDAYLQFSAGPQGPFRTQHVDCRIAMLDWQKAGLTWTASGYGAKIATRYMVRYANRWRRVYATRFSNAGTAWVLIDGEKVSVTL